MIVIVSYNNPSFGHLLFCSHKVRLFEFIHGARASLGTPDPPFAGIRSRTRAHSKHRGPFPWYVLSTQSLPRSRTLIPCDTAPSARAARSCEERAARRECAVLPKRDDGNLNGKVRQLERGQRHLVNLLRASAPVLARALALFRFSCHGKA